MKHTYIGETVSLLFIWVYMYKLINVHERSCLGVLHICGIKSLFQCKYGSEM